MKLIHTILAIIISFTVTAQYAFESKKTEKFYYKMENAWLDYDYQKILDSEEEINASFLYNEDTVAANMYSFLGEAYYYELGELQKALDFYNTELELRKKIQPDESSSEVLALIALINSDLGNYGKSEAILKEVVKLDKEKYGSSDEIYFASVMSLADLYIQIEKPDQGLTLLNDLKKDIPKNTLDEVGLLKSIGDCYAIQGSYRRAENAFNNATETSEKNGLEASFEYVSTLNSYGILLMDLGKIPEAEDMFNYALSIIDRIQGENEDARSGINGNLAKVYYTLGDYSKAIKLQRQILNEDKEFYGETSFTYGQSVLNLALTLLYDKKYTESEKLHNEALEIFRISEGEEGTNIGYVYNNLTKLYQEKGEIDKAIEFGNKALSNYKKLFDDDHPEVAFTSSNLANAHLAYDEIGKAEPLARRAYDIRRKKLGSNHPLFARSANQMAILSWKKGETKDALKYYKETFDNYFTQINAFFPVLTEEEKTKFYYTKLKPGFEQYISFIEDNSSEDKELIGEIYNYQLALKGIIMSASTKVRNSILNSGDEELISKYDEWISQKEQMAKLYSASSMDLEERNSQIESLTASSNQLEADLSANSDVFGKNFANRKQTWQDIREKLKPGEAAIEVVRYKDFVTDSAGIFTDEVHYAALIVKHDTEDYPEMVIIRNGKVMETKYLANYRNAIRFRVKENYSYKFFWKPIANKLDGIQKVYFSPDGVYNQVSIYTFRNPSTNEYLIHEFDLQVVTNTKDLLADNTVNNDGGSVFFGYPNYNLGTDNESDKDADNRGMRGMRGMSGGERGLRSGAGGGLERGTVVPRGVRGNLIRYMKANNALALLPGTKKEVELIGEGVYGLQRAFRIAGAESLIMSMWSVDDNATQELMTNFYEEWLTHGDKSKAFITAQKRLKEKYPKPFYWGAFVMVGY